MENQKNSNIKTYIIPIVAVLFIVALVIGATYAYWAWSTNSSQQTQVNVVIGGGQLVINGESTSAKELVPISSCYSSDYTATSVATVTATNDSTTNSVTAYLEINAKFAKNASVTNTPDATDMSHVHWAIKEVTSTSDAYSTANCSTGATATGTLTTTALSTDGETIDTTITIPVATAPDTDTPTVVTKYYQVYMWLDSTYNDKSTSNTCTSNNLAGCKYVNTGDTIVDPLQGASYTISWSSTSRIA